MSVTVNGTNGLTFNDNTTQATSPFAGGLGFRNRIINGDMRIDQRNNGASVSSVSGAYTLDRWQASASINSRFTVQRSTVAPAGFSNSLLVTSSAATSLAAGDFFAIRQTVEGFNVADFAWGTASAQTVTISFWVRSSLTGTFGGAVFNGAANRSYPFTFTVSAANTFEYKTVTILGDTTGTWATDNSTGLFVSFSLGAGSTYSGTSGSWVGATILSPTGATSVVGTNGATFYITGVQLEKGSTATSFDYRPYGTELALCQRYYEVKGIDASGYSAVGYYYGTNNYWYDWQFKVTKRATPTIIGWSGVTNYPSVEHCQFNDTVTSFVSTETLTASAEL